MQGRNATDELQGCGGEARQLGLSQRSPIRDAGAYVIHEVDSVDQLHGEEAVVVGDHQVVQANQVRVHDTGQDSELLLEAVEIVRAARRQPLQRDLSAEL